MEQIFSIALTTFRESIRSKILYSVFFFAALVVALAAFFGKVTIGDQIKVLKDFGLMSISLFSVAFAVISGGALLHKELSKKTIYNILSKPISRSTFIIGKYLGMVMTLTVLVVLLGAFLSGFLYVFEKTLDLGLFQAYAYILIELLVISAAAIFFSAIVVTPLLSGLFTFGLFLAGRSAEFILQFQQLSGDSISRIVYWVLPHLYQLNISNGIVYGETQSPENMIWSLIYAVGYAGILLTLALLGFARREFH